MRLTQPPAAEWKPGATAAPPLLAEQDLAWPAYPEPSEPAPLTATVGTGQLLPAGFARVGRAVQVLLGLCGATSVARIGFELWGLQLLGTVPDGDFSALDLYHQLGVSFGFGAATLTALTGVLWLAWQHRLADAVPRSALRRSPRWHVASWLIPVVNLWFPYQNITDLRRAVTPTSGANRSPLAYPLWWGLWVADSLTRWWVGALSQPQETTWSTMGQSAAGTAVGEALSAGSAVCAILVVGDLTRRAAQARDDAVAESELR